MYTPPEAYLLGRGYKQTVKGQTHRGQSCLERLRPIPDNLIYNTRGSLALAAGSAQDWINRARTEGHTWDLFPQPSVSELRPNMTSTSDQPWHHAKQQIGSRLEDLTLLWYVGVDKRDAANRAGFFRWTEQGYDAEDLGVKGKTIDQ